MIQSLISATNAIAYVVCLRETRVKSLSKDPWPGISLGLSHPCSQTYTDGINAHWRVSSV